MSKINLPVAELKPALVGLGKVISKRSTLPVLGMLKLDRSKDGWITITATDLDSFVTVRLEQPAEGEPVSVLIPHDDLTRITKRCGKDETLLVEPKCDKVLIQFPIGNQIADEHVASLPAEEFPPVPKIKSEPVSINNEIRQSLQEAFQCASTDETRLILNGAFVDVSDQKCQHIIGTNGRLLYSSNSFTVPLKDSVLIPSHRFLEWKEFNNDGEWQLRVALGKDARLQLSSRRWRFIIRQIEGNYPNWKQVVPQSGDLKTTVLLSAGAVESAIKLIQKIPSYDSVNNTIGLKIEEKLFLLGRDDEKSKWSDFGIEGVTVKGSPATVYLNRNYLTQALKLGLTEIQIIDPLSPVRFVNQGKQLIVMPVRADAQAQTRTVTSPAAAPAKAPTTPPPAEQPKETPMAENGNTNGTGHHAPVAEKSALETALTQVETIRGEFRNALTGLTKLGDTLKAAQREQKASARETQSVRQTLRSLQSVKI